MHDCWSPRSRLKGLAILEAAMHATLGLIFKPRLIFNFIADPRWLIAVRLGVTPGRRCLAIGVIKAVDDAAWERVAGAGAAVLLPVASRGRFRSQRWGRRSRCAAPLPARGRGGRVATTTAPSSAFRLRDCEKRSMVSTGDPASCHSAAPTAVGRAIHAIRD